jgi:GT2 family glycosyltransferase
MPSAPSQTPPATRTSAPRASIVLPTYNGEHELEQLLPALAAQRLRGGFEILAVDSSSRDASVSLLREFDADVEIIDTADFRHGRTRNLCAERARGECLVFLSQDVIPQGPDYLEKLLEPFEDERVAGSYARVMPLKGSDLLSARTVLDLPESSEQPVVRDLDGVAGLWELEPSERAEYLRFNNVASAIRRSVFRELPFPDVAFGEDFAWAARALTAGWRIAYTPEAVVEHAHRYGPRTAFKRYRVDALFHREAHGWLLRPSLASVLRGWLYELRADVRAAAADGWLGHVPDLLRAPALRAGQVLGQYAGSRGWRGGSRSQAGLARDLSFLDT